MLKELKKLDQPGGKEDIIFFLQTVIGHRNLSEKDIRKICAHSSGNYQLDVDSLLLYCTYLNLIEHNETVVLSGDVISCIHDNNILNDFIIERTISKLFRNQIFKADMFTYDLINEKFTFQNQRLPLAAASIRNILISQEFFEIHRSAAKTDFFINVRYEKLISSFCQGKKRQIGIEQLQKQLELNNQAGEKAEQYALEYERSRINDFSLSNKIKIISDIDVCAGYDIISFDNLESTDYNRFIEVKAVSHSNSFYWSKNELDTARLKGKQYYIYLVDLQRSSDKNYVPKIINDPASILFDSDEWFAEPQTFKIQYL